jgi:hypothetical protein
MDFTLDQKVGGIQTEYATIIGTNDAICISWITMKNLDGASDSAWTGDVAEQCGMSYHWGNDKAGTLKDTGEDHRPYCAWLDADHTNGLTTGALKIYFSAYGQKLTDTIAKQTGCSNTKFEYNAASIDGMLYNNSRLDDEDADQYKRCARQKAL